MALPILKILVIENNKAHLEQISANITKCVTNFERTDIIIQVIEAPSVLSAIGLIESDGDIQAVVLSWDVEGRWEDIEEDKQGVIHNNTDIINAIKGIRVSVPIYILGDESIGLDIVNESEDIESFFFKDDIISDPESILGYILNDFDDRAQTPFWTAYKKYVTENNDSWHTPGHSGGSSFRHSPYIQDFYQFYGRNVFVGDLSVSVDSLGSLSEGSHMIGKAQEAAAYTFEVTKTYFVTNGSSTSNKIILQTLLRENDTVIVDRNCHKSVHYGLIQARATPIYLNSILSSQYGIFAPPSLDEIRQLIDKHKEARLLVLTGCTYDGLLMDLSQVVDMAHAHGIKVFIDEAWFAYSLFHPLFRPYSAIHAGADYITHSAHKVVSAFSQASYIHVNDPDFDADFFHEIYSIYSSTSPKYQIIASLDICRKQLEMEGYGIINSLLDHVTILKEQMRTFKNIRILDCEDFKHAFSHFEKDAMGHDPLKILIDVSQLEYSTHEIHRYLLDEIGLEIEKFTHSTILVLLTFGGTRSKVIRLYNALKKLDQKKVAIPMTKHKRKIPDRIPEIKLSCLPAKAFFGEREIIDLDNSVGRISSGLVCPYPPGIPLLVSGQIIEKEHIDYLKALSSQKTHIQGFFDGELYVLNE
ncbi:MAG: aminotransferase class V-fold PLP-dependent enzyme [Proteobacteria bacterium]|nr:aminotransferase class V-fold PLP-dependent enzyme [Pseudomonadota bacterium]